MAKHKAHDRRSSSNSGGIRNGARPHSRQPLEVMSLDESETLLGGHYIDDHVLSAASLSGSLGRSGHTKAQQQHPSVTIVDLDCVERPSLSPLALHSSIASHRQRLPSISSVAIPSPYTEQTTITSAGTFRWPAGPCHAVDVTVLLHISHSGRVAERHTAGDRRPARAERSAGLG